MRNFARAGAAGSAAVEFALILPLALACIIGVIEFGRVIWTQATLDYAVEAAARCAAINATVCGTVAQIQQYAVDRAPGLSLPTSTFTAASGSCGAQVSASLQFDFLVPGLLPYAPRLTASACFPT